jgi:hypothetical protein
MLSSGSPMCASICTTYMYTTTVYVLGQTLPVSNLQFAIEEQTCFEDGLCTLHDLS